MTDESGGPTLTQAPAPSLTTTQESSGQHRQVPAFGTLTYFTLPHGDIRRKVADVLYHAACWRKLCESEYLGEVVTEWILWNQRRTRREAEHAVVAGLKELHPNGWNWLPHRELVRRRNHYDRPPKTAGQIRAEAQRPWVLK